MPLYDLVTTLHAGAWLCMRPKTTRPTLLPTHNSFLVRSRGQEKALPRSLSSGVFCSMLALRRLLEKHIFDDKQLGTKMHHLTGKGLNGRFNGLAVRRNAH